MLDLNAARQKMLAECRPTPSETCELSAALNRVLSADVIAPIDAPRFDTSAMDGFALNSRDVQAAAPASPAPLTVVGAVETGRPPIRLGGRGAAARIMTGGALPPDADCVIPFEDTAEGAAAKDGVNALKPAKPGQYVRRAGDDTKAGTLALKRGTQLNPAAIGLLASLGVAAAPVHRRPRVALISTGDELVKITQTPQIGQIYDANAYALSAALGALGAETRFIQTAADDKRSLNAALEQIQNCDLAVSTGGVSVGDRDFVKSVLEARGEVIFWKINLKPGKPTVFGKLRAATGDIPFLGLPGNPVSALVGVHLLARPMLRVMSGLPPGELAQVDAVLDETVDNADGRHAFFRAMLYRQNGERRITAKYNQQSNALRALALSNALLVCPAGIVRIESGVAVNAILLEIPESLSGVIN